MFRVFLKTSEISFHENVNMWLYYISKIPKIGAKISEKGYKKIGSKKYLSYIVKLISFLFRFISKLLYIFCIVIIPANIISKATGLDVEAIQFQIFFVLSFIIGTILENNICAHRQKDFYMINLMRFDASEYYKGKIIYEYLRYLIFFIVPIMFLGVSFERAILITLSFIGIRATGQYIHLCLIEKFNFKFIDNIYAMLFVIFGGGAIAFLTPFVGVTFKFKRLLFSNWFLFATILSGIIFLIKILKYEKYTLLAKTLLRKSELENLDVKTKEMAFMDVKINEKNIKTEDLINDKYNEKQGIEYLNLKFIERHKKIIYRPIKRKVIFFIIIFVVSLVGLMIFTESKENVRNLILSSAGALVYIMYIISTGEKITKAFFFNCDKSLLRYRFYTEPKIVLASFKSRLKLCFLLEMIQAVTIGIGLGIIYIVSGGNLIEYIPMFISILALGSFFAVHHLFLYYIAQPYTSQLKIKSPIYTIVGLVITLIACMCINVRGTTIAFTILIIIVTIVYILIALFLVYKYSYKTFRLK